MHSAVSVQEKLPVVVGIDGMPADLQIVDVAATEAAHRAVPLEVVHAWPGRHPGVRRQRSVLPDPAEGRHLLELADRRARHRHPGLPVRTGLADDGAAEALLRCSARACLLVVGHRDEAVLGHGWGMTTAYLAHHSACPLLVHRGPPPERGPVVVAVSGRRSATVPYAFAEASRFGCALVAVHVRDPRAVGDDASRRRHETADPLAALRADGAETWPGVPVERLSIGEADIAYTTERASRRSRLLVAGRGHKGWLVEQLYSATGIGTASRRLCPVLLIPPGWAEPAG